MCGNKRRTIVTYIRCAYVGFINEQLVTRNSINGVKMKMKSWHMLIWLVGLEYDRWLELDQGHY